ncbi:hypothetical protein TNCV_3552331 [Trichonephila clavipes]|nr:hypothetical protein TNCV_3552331 [Trichonephila clavipes]
MRKLKQVDIPVSAIRESMFKQGGYHSSRDKEFTSKIREGCCYLGYRDIKIMATPGSLFTPTPLGQEDNLELFYAVRWWTWQPSGQDSELACQEFEPSTAEDPTFRRRCTFNKSSLKHPPFGVLWYGI